jgi:hypothetical protein
VADDGQANAGPEGGNEDKQHNDKAGERTDRVATHGAQSGAPEVRLSEDGFVQDAYFSC